MSATTAQTVTNPTSTREFTFGSTTITHTLSQPDSNTYKLSGGVIISRPILTYEEEHEFIKTFRNTVSNLLSECFANCNTNEKKTLKVNTAHTRAKEKYLHQQNILNKLTGDNYGQ